MDTLPLRLALLLTASLAFAGCTGGGDEGTDADGDGVPDRVELGGWTIRVLAQEGPVSRHVTSDPHARDTDGDGLEDYDERVRGTDPRRVDTDGDGLLDGMDVVLEPESDLAVAWRESGLVESPRGTFLGEIERCEEAGLRPAEWSSDRPFPDGLGDGDEVRGWVLVLRGRERHVVGDPCVADADGDGLKDDEEKALGTDPGVADTDGDGAPDGADADPLWDLGLRVENATLEAGGRAVDVFFGVGFARERLEGDALDLDVPDGSPRLGSLNVTLLLEAVDRTTGEPVDLLPYGSQAVLTFDLFGRSAKDHVGRSMPGRIVLEGEQGSFSFDWHAARA